MSRKRITLKRRAAEMREEAQAKLDELKDRVSRQSNDELDEGESRLSADEIRAEKDEIHALTAEAKELEDLNSIEGLARRSDDASSGAREIMNEAAGGSERPDDKSAFRNAGEFLRAIRAKSGGFDSPVDLTDDQRREMRATRIAATRLNQGENVSERTIIQSEMARKALVGDDDTSDGRGDHLVPEEHLAELLRAMGEQQQFVPLARRVPMARPTVDFPRLAQTDGNDERPMHSMAAVTKIAQGAQIDEREPTFEQLQLTAVKYAAYLEAADELLTDSIIDLQPVLIDLLTGAISYEYDRDCIRGDGTGEPQGYIGSDAEYAVERQASNDVGVVDIFELEARFFGDEGSYFFHGSAIPKLYALTDDNMIVWNGDLASSVPGTLLGRPLRRTAKVPTLGSKGDISLVDPKMFLAGDLQRITVANSVDFRFRNAVTAWRAQFRAAGTPWPAGTFSHEADGAGTKDYEVSPFVVLDSAVAS